MATTKQPKKRVFCDARKYLAEAEGHWSTGNDMMAGYAFMVALWRFLYCHCIYERCIPPSMSDCLGHGDFDIGYMNRDVTAMRKSLAECGALRQDSARRILAGFQWLAWKSFLQDESSNYDKYLDANIAMFESFIRSCSKRELRSTKRTHKGGWTIRDARRALQTSKARKSADANGKSKAKGTRPSKAARRSQGSDRRQASNGKSRVARHRCSA